MTSELNFSKEKTVFTSFPRNFCDHQSVKTMSHGSIERYTGRLCELDLTVHGGSLYLKFINKHSNKSRKVY
jgi:hypothetical protein